MNLGAERMQEKVVEKLRMVFLWGMFVLLVREAIMAGWLDKLIQ